jgi:hypothetical protein
VVSGRPRPRVGSEKAYADAGVARQPTVARSDARTIRTRESVDARRSRAAITRSRGYAIMDRRPSVHRAGGAERDDGAGVVEDQFDVAGEDIGPDGRSFAVASPRRRSAVGATPAIRSPRGTVSMDNATLPRET